MVAGDRSRGGGGSAIGHPCIRKAQPWYHLQSPSYTRECVGEALAAGVVRAHGVPYGVRVDGEVEHEGSCACMGGAGGAGSGKGGWGLRVAAWAARM